VSDLLAAARRLADERLAPGAADVDRDGVRRADLDALGAAGLLGAALAPPATFRAVQEALAGADASTWFVQAQHHYPVRLLASATSPELVAVRDDLVAGRRVAGVAFSHLRRWPGRPVEVTRVTGGWRYDGLVPWFTGWGLNDVLALGGATADGEVVFGLVDARADESLQPTEPLRLAAMSAAGTVQLRLQGLVVPDERVVARLSVQDWLAADVRTTVALNPAVLGITEAAIRRLAAVGEQRGLGPAQELAPLLAGRLADVRARAYALADEAQVRPEASLAVRAQGQRLALDATAALVAASGGAAMSLTDPAQRWAREALFLVVQGQTVPARETLLRTWA
jgi:hypothetical protein